MSVTTSDSTLSLISLCCVFCLAVPWNEQCILVVQIFEPVELERGHLTDRDKVIAMTDLPERFQVCVHLHCHAVQRQL